MCYEERFFLQRATTKAQKREEPKSVIERLRPSAPPDRPNPETDKPKEVEPELETV
jgi:sRNA-binding protein